MATGFALVGVGIHVVVAGFALLISLLGLFMVGAFGRQSEIEAFLVGMASGWVVGVVAFAAGVAGTTWVKRRPALAGFAFIGGALTFPAALAAGVRDVTVFVKLGAHLVGWPFWIAALVAFAAAWDRRKYPPPNRKAWIPVRQTV